MSESVHSRRTIIKGAAWSLPVIAMATAVPAQAASLCTAESTDLVYEVNGTSLVVTNTNAAGCVWSGSLFVAYQVYLYPYHSSPYTVGGIMGVKVLDRVQRVYYSEVPLGVQSIDAGASVSFEIAIYPYPAGQEPDFDSGEFSAYQTFILSDGTYYVDGTNRIAHGANYGIDVFGPSPFNANIPD